MATVTWPGDLFTLLNLFPLGSDSKSTLWIKTPTDDCSEDNVSTGAASNSPKTAWFKNELMALVQDAVRTELRSMKLERDGIIDGGSTRLC